MLAIEAGKEKERDLFFESATLPNCCLEMPAPPTIKDNLNANELEKIIGMIVIGVQVCFTILAIAVLKDYLLKR